MCDSSPRTVDEQAQRVVMLRDVALRLLHRDGEWQDVEGYPGRVRSYHGEHLMMLHRTPFQPPPVSEAAVAAGVGAQAQRDAARDYGLDIWRDNRKVFSAIWNNGDVLHVVMFRPGPWEDELVQAAR